MAGGARCGTFEFGIESLPDGFTILITPAFGVCFGVVGSGGLTGGCGRAGGDFGRLGGIRGMPKLL